MIEKPLKTTLTTGGDPRNEKMIRGVAPSIFAKEIKSKNLRITC